MRRVMFAAALAALSTAAAGQPAAAPPPRPAPPPVTQGSGPWPALMEVDPSLDFHVVYRPADPAVLAPRKLGVVVWGNGGCRDDGASARAHLTEIASHGYLVIAPGKLYPPGESAPSPRRGPDGKYPPQATTAEQVSAGIDWALAENARAGSRYHGRIDPAGIAVAGHSCGGLQALQVAPDPRIRTVIVHNSGIFNAGSSITGLDLDKESLAKVHTPILYILGGATDQALPNGSDDFARIDHVPAVLIDLPVGHGGTFTKRDGGGRGPDCGRLARLATARRPGGGADVQRRELPAVPAWRSFDSEETDRLSRSASCTLFRNACGR
jgi:dienelactone hydrolase